MAESRICPICNCEFLPSKYRKAQRVCSRKDCQKRRQLENLTTWRKNNPGYFKTSRHDSSWALVYRERSKTWRKKHRSKIKKYKKEHKEEQREYMREYMFRMRHYGI